MTVLAAVDCGTNSTRLLVAEPTPRGPRPLRYLERDMVVTRLGKGVDATGRLDDGALEKTLAVLEDYAQRWRLLGAERVRISATSAIRDAEDRQRFFEGVRARTGATAEVLTGEDEAALSFRGATTSVTAPGPYLVLDIGGGSTELILGGSRPEASISRQIGCVRLTERFLHDDPPSPDQYAAAVAAAHEHLDAVAEVVDPSPARTLIGVAGTVTTLAGIHLGLPEYDAEAIHGTRLSLSEVRQLIEDLAWITSAERAALGPVQAGREDVLVAGALILVTVMERFGFDELLVSEADILDGLLLSLLD